MNKLDRLLNSTIVMVALTLSACGGGSIGSNRATPPAPQPNPPQTIPEITYEQRFAGISFQGLVSLQQAPGDSGRWFAVERRGIVWVFDNDNGASTATPFIDISSQVDSAPDEAGLLGMAFHPNWGSNGNFEVFLSYTRSGSPLVSTVSRFFSFDNGLSLDSSVEEVLMTLLQDSGNHNGGNLAFGPDGFLYGGWGDGGGAGDTLDRAQNSSNLLGSITRIDVDSAAPYAVPADNPFSANAFCSQGFGAAQCPELYAWGFRNPWRWSFDRMTGDLWVGDVGQGSIEEVDRVALGGNYGWRCKEGATEFDTSGNCLADLIDPITEYDHNVGQSITGGFVYRGTAIPNLHGWYIFADFVTGKIFAVLASSTTGTVPQELLDTSVLISSFAEDSNGELYILDLNGEIFQIVEGR